MSENYGKKTGPLVSVLLPTFNRPQYLYEALASVLYQSYRNLQIIVVNDGGEDVSAIVNAFNNPRIIFINRKENRGLPFTLNEAFTHAKGKYICYLGDDDLYYSHHVSTLLDALENQTDCHVAYSDLYKVYCRIMPDGSRQVLSKVVQVSRDFDRFLMLQFNHTLHVSLMHRRDLLEKIGPYNEDLNVLIDWDLTRRLVFFSDFYHVCEITGEYYNPMGECDRISVQQRKDKNEYIRNVQTIQTTRPAKPWLKIKDMSIIFTTDRLNRQTGINIGLIWRYTFYPYKVYLPLPQVDVSRLNADMPNLILVAVDPSSSQAQRIDTALEKCDGEYIAIVPDGFPIRQFWLEDPLHALINKSAKKEGLELEGSTQTHWAAVVEKKDLLYARKSSPHLSVRDSLKAAGISIRNLHAEEIPFQFDQLIQQALTAEKEGRWAHAAHMYEYIAEHYQNRLWMKALAAKAFFKAAELTRAAELSYEVNQKRPTVDTLLLEAKINREKKQFHSAIKLLKKAEQILGNPIQHILDNRPFSGHGIQRTASIAQIGTG